MIRGWPWARLVFARWRWLASRRRRCASSPAATCPGRSRADGAGAARVDRRRRVPARQRPVRAAHPGGRRGARRRSRSPSPSTTAPTRCTTRAIAAAARVARPPRHVLRHRPARRRRAGAAGGAGPARPRARQSLVCARLHHAVPASGAAGRDLARAQALFATAGARVRFFRPPVGLLSPRVAEAARRIGLTIVGWSATARDGARHRRRRTQATARLIAAARPGAILVLHDAAERGRRRRWRPRRWRRC